MTHCGGESEYEYSYSLLQRDWIRSTAFNKQGFCRRSRHFSTRTNCDCLPILTLGPIAQFFTTVPAVARKTWAWLQFYSVVLSRIRRPGVCCKVNTRLVIMNHPKTQLRHSPPLRNGIKTGMKHIRLVLVATEPGPVQKVSTFRTITTSRSTPFPLPREDGMTDWVIV